MCRALIRMTDADRKDGNVIGSGENHAALQKQALRILPGVFRIGIQQERGSGQVFADMHINRTELLEMPLHFFMDFTQSGGELRYTDRFQKIRDDAILDCALRIFKIIIAGQKCNRNERLKLPNTLCQLCSGDKGHLNIGQKQIRLQLFHQLQRIQSVSGASDQAKTNLLPADHAADRFPQFLFIIGYDNGIGFSRHVYPPSVSVPDYTGDIRFCKERRPGRQPTGSSPE